MGSNIETERCVRIRLELEQMTSAKIVISGREYRVSQSKNIKCRSKALLFA